MRIYRSVIRPFLVLLISILLPIGWSTDARAQEAVTFVVDGTDLLAGLRAPESEYLKDSPVVSQLSVAAGRIQDIPWNRHMADKVSVSNAVALLKSSIKAANDKGITVNIVTHSYGSVIAYTALKELGKDGPQIENFVTLSSPLGRVPMAKVIPEQGSAIPIPSAKEIRESLQENLNIKPGRWINRYAKNDSLGGEITVKGVNNRMVEGVTHTSILSDQETVREIATGLETGNYQGALYDKSHDFRDATANVLIHSTRTSLGVAVNSISGGRVLETKRRLNRDWGRMAVLWRRIAETRRLFLNGNIRGDASGAAGEFLRRIETSRTKNVLDKIFAPETTLAASSKTLQTTPRVPYAIPLKGKIQSCRGGECSVRFGDGELYGIIQIDPLGISTDNTLNNSLVSLTVGNKVTVLNQNKEQSAVLTFIAPPPPILSEF